MCGIWQALCPQCHKPALSVALCSLALRDHNIACPPERWGVIQNLTVNGQWSQLKCDACSGKHAAEWADYHRFQREGQPPTQRMRSRRSRLAESADKHCNAM